MSALSEINLSTRHTWRTLLDDLFGLSISDAKAERWAEILHERVDVTPDDLMATLIWVAEKREKDRYTGKPTLEDIGIWVKWRRKVLADERRGYREADTEDGFMAACKSALLRCRDHVERFDMICNPDRLAHLPRTTTQQECEALDKWACERWPDWEGERTAIRKELAADMRRVREMAAPAL